MPDPAEPTEHPTITLADKVGEKVAEHITKASQAGAAHETARRHTALTATAESLRNDLKPAMHEMFGAMIEQLPADDPTRKFFDLFMSPESALNDALINILGFAGMVLAAISETGKVFFQPLLNELWNSRPRMPLSPADAADAVVQGYMTLQEGQTEASYSGYGTTPFNRMVDITGQPPSPEDLMQMFRREIIPQGTDATDFPSVFAGLAEGHTKDPWIPYFQKLAYVWPSPVDFINAAIREQFPTKADAFAWAAKAGLDVTTQTEIGSFADILFDIGGRPPGPEEAARMAHRGIIPWSGTGPTATTFQQSIAESDLKTKWTSALQALSTFVPTNGEITQWVQQGFIDRATALPLYANNGVTADTAAIFIETALVQQVAQDRQLAKGEILAMYEAGLLDKTETTDALGVIGFHGDIATELISLADFRREAASFNRLVQQIGRQLVQRKISVPAAQDALTKMGVPARTMADLLNDWQVTLDNEISNITASQIATAVYYQVETPDQGYADLKLLGYSPYDAWRILSIRLHTPVKLTGGNPPRPPGAGTL